MKRVGRVVRAIPPPDDFDARGTDAAPQLDVHAVSYIAHSGNLYRSNCGMVLLATGGRLEWGSRTDALVFKWTEDPATCAWCVFKGFPGPAPQVTGKSSTPE